MISAYLVLLDLTSPIIQPQSFPTNFLYCFRKASGWLQAINNPPEVSAALPSKNLKSLAFFSNL